MENRLKIDIFPVNKSISNTSKNSSDIGNRTNLHSKSNVNSKSETKTDKEKTEKKLEICEFCGKEIDENHNDIFKNQSASFNNDSGALRNNMGDSEEAKRITKKIKLITGLKSDIDSEATAAHHIISGNQIFKQYDKLVKIALVAGYDINSKENGIYLPTLTNYLKKRLNFEGRKAPVAYEVMDEVKSQWHVGGHSYTVEGLEDVEFDNYVTELGKKVKTLENKLLRTLKCVDDENQNKMIIKSLNKLSNEVKVSLEKFRNNPKDSKPYYVSKVALEYAYGLDNKVYFIAFEVKNNKIIAYKRRYNNNKNIIEKSIFDNDVNIFSIEDRFEFVKFCKDIVNFVTWNNEECRNFSIFKDLNSAFTIDLSEKINLLLSIDDNKYDLKEYLKKNNRHEKSRELIKLRKEEIKCIM